jgi:hypothetical protein
MNRTFLAIFRGHDVLVVGASAHMQFFKQAAARHSSNTTAESLRYREIDLAAAAQGRKHVGKQVMPGQVTQQRFAGVPGHQGLDLPSVLCVAISWTLQVHSFHPPLRSMTLISASAAAAECATHHRTPNIPYTS